MRRIRGTHGKEGNIQDRDVQRHAECDRADKEGVLPHWQSQQTLVLGERVHRVEHLYRDEDRQAYRGGTMRHDVREHLTADLRE